MKKTLLATLIASLALTGCDAEPQDTHTAGMSSTIYGKVIDPYIVGSKVYADVNNNGRHDIFEDFTFTDINGEFSLAVASNGRHVILRTLSGFDKTSVQENLASLSVGIEPDASQQVNITPLSSLLHRLDNTGKTNLANLLDPASLDSDGQKREKLEKLAQTDFVADFTAGTDTDGLVKNLAIHKPITVLTAKLDALYDDDKFDDIDLPDDFGSVVYDEFAKALHNSSDLDTLLNDVMVGAAQELKDIVNEDTQAIVPPTLGDTSLILAQAKQISELAADVATSQGLTGSNAQLNGLVRAVDVVNAKIVKGKTALEITQAIDAAKDTTADGYYHSLESAETLNLNAAINAADVETADISVANEDKFDFVTGFGLRFTEAQGNNQEDTIVQLYFQPSGALTICARVTLDEEDMQDFNVDTSGFILNGNYTKLDDISVLSKFTLLGNILNPVITLSGSNSYSISLESEGFDEELDGVKFTLPDNLPGSDSNCKFELDNFI